MNTTKKITKRDLYSIVSAIITEAENQGFGLPEGVTFADLTEFVDHEVELLDKKAESAAKRAATKREVGDALREKIASALTDEYQPIAAIVAALGDSGITPQMATPRLKQLCDIGFAEKDQVTVPGVDGKSRKVSAYKRA